MGGRPWVPAAKRAQLQGAWVWMHAPLVIRSWQWSQGWGGQWIRGTINELYCGMGDGLAALKLPSDSPQFWSHVLWGPFLDLVGSAPSLS